MHIKVNGARLFFDVVGPKLQPDGDRMAERPTLIVLHGGPGFDHAGLRPYFDRFADTHQVIYLDHRGNGRSDGEPEGWTLAQWGDDIHAFCQALGIERPAVLGLSFGGMVTMSYAARHPEAPSRLILSSTAARMDLRNISKPPAGRKPQRIVPQRMVNFKAESDPTPIARQDARGGRRETRRRSDGGRLRAAIRECAIRRRRTPRQFPPYRLGPPRREARHWLPPPRRARF